MFQTDHKATQLAGQAATLSGELYALQEQCKHESTTEEISSVADELARLSTTLWTLSNAITASPDQYTDAFNQDLAEIVAELAAVFEEISDCCNDLQSADSTTSSVPWFFKQGRVARLVKHLDALKGTLMIMRTVLFHGKDYGTHRSNRLAESSPHTMREDRVILESLLARNREAILNMHKLTEVATTTRTMSRPQSPERAGRHHRELSESTGVEISPTPDVLPPGEASAQRRCSSTDPVKLNRTFTKRGARLGVHMSIMDAGAHTAPHALKEKWLQQAYHRQDLDHAQHKARGLLTEKPELSRISEADTSTGSCIDLSKTPVRPSKLYFNTPIDDTLESAQKRSSTISASSVRRALSRLSMTNLRAPRLNLRSGDEGSRNKENKSGPGGQHVRHRSDSTVLSPLSVAKYAGTSNEKTGLFGRLSKKTEARRSLDATRV